MKASVNHVPPDFLVKTTLGCSLVVVLILIPFTINNFIQGRFYLGLATILVAVACAINVWYGYLGKYSLPINTYLVAPAGGLTIVYTMITLGPVGSYWPYLLVLSFYFVLPEQRAWIVNALTILVFLPVAWQVLDQSSAVRFTAALFGVSLFAFISIREINVLHGLLRKQAVTDKLTGLYNRSLLQDSLEHAFNQNRRSGTPMALIMLDIDRFKTINDEQGHDVGDSALKSVGEFLIQHVRGSDMVFRVGGEEFLVLLYNTDEYGGVEIAEKLRREIERFPLAPNLSVTVSLGVAGLQPDIDVDEWLKRVDEKLYRAKVNGRNQVIA